MNSDNRRSGSLFMRIVLVASLAVTSLFLLRPIITSQGKDKEVKPAAVSEAKSLEASELGKLINQTIDESGMSDARWGVCAISMKDGSIVFERNGDKLFTPASNMKIFTTGVALDLLGADYRWRTSVYASSQPGANGVVPGDLTLYGRGAPDLVTRSKDEGRGSLEKLADALYARGVKRIKGNVIGDESYFRGDPLGDGWLWTDLQWYFGAEASALSINGNEVAVNLAPSTKKGEAAEARTSDTENYVTVQNRMAVGESSRRSTMGLHRGLSDNNVEAWGEFAPGAKGFGARVSVHKPALWAAKLFLAVLKSRGIAVEGQALTRDSRVAPSQRFDPSRSVEIAYVQSQPLSEIARKTNKDSINLFAELILRTLGRERSEMAAMPEAVGRERGDDEAGLTVMRVWLNRQGIATERLALHDGSGLSRLDLVTPQSSARLLIAMSKTASAEVFKTSLPIAGRDGTLGSRLEKLTDRVSAKTGYITYDHALSGYVTTTSGELLAFSIMCNDQTGRGNSMALIDQIVTLLAEFSGKSPKPQ